MNGSHHGYRAEADALFVSEIASIQRQTDKTFAALLLGEWAFGVLCALIVSPRTWLGDSSGVHLHVYAAVLLGGLLALFPCWMAARRPGALATRLVIATAQACFSGLLIHLMGGRIEAHFHVFGSLALLAFYRDPLVFVPAVSVVVLDHAFRGMYWPLSVYGVGTASLFRSIEHGAWVAFETGFLLWGVSQGRGQLRRMADLQASLTAERNSLDHRVQDRTQRLSRAKKALEAVFDAVDRSQGRIEFTPDRKVLDVNNNYLMMFGYARGEVLGADHSIFVSPEDRSSEAYEEAWRRLRRGEHLGGEFVRYAKDGSLRWIQATYNPVLDEDGFVTKVVKYAIDVTPQKRAELQRAKLLEDLARRTLLLDSVLESVGDGIVAIDLGGDVLASNHGAARLLGEFARKPEASGEGALFYQESEGRARLTPHPLRDAIDGAVFTNRRYVVRIGEQTAVYLVSVAPLSSDAHHGGVAIFKDITEQEQLKKQLLHSQKMESIGQLASGIAHEINTPMQCIQSSIGYLSRQMDGWSRSHAAALEVVTREDHPEDAGQAIGALADALPAAAVVLDSQEALEDCRLCIDRIVEIIGAMKEFAHPGQDESVLVDVNQCLRNATVITRNRTKKCATVEFDLSECPPVLGGASALNQTFVNLLVNAADAIGAVRRESDPLGRIVISTRRLGAGVEVMISDTGCGMTADVARRAFDPFFTTKDVGKGSGQGLAIAYHAIVEQCGGTIAIDSSPGRGATFRIFLPTGPRATEGAGEGEASGAGVALAPSAPTVTPHAEALA